MPAFFFPHRSDSCAARSHVLKVVGRKLRDWHQALREQWRPTRQRVKWPFHVLYHYDEPEELLVTRSAHFQRHSGAGVGSGPGLVQFNASMHQQFLQLVGCDRGSYDGSGVTIAVLDTGIDAATRSMLARRVKAKVDVIGLDDPNGPSTTADDGHGHGSAVVRIVAEAAVGAEFIVVRALDAKRQGSEWELITGLHGAKAMGAQVINLSLGTELAGLTTCPRCGRRGRNVRAQAIERTILDWRAQGVDPPVIVAAAENDGVPDLTFPARFRDVLGVAATNSGGTLSAFTNRGTDAWPAGQHPQLFVAPGGEAPVKPTSPSQVSEWVATYAGSGDRFHGTSAACAYATGVAARVIESWGYHDATSVASAMSQLAGNNRYDNSGFGNGLVLAP